MKKLIAIISVAALLGAATASAQSFETGYFLDNYSYSHRLNPALHSSTNVVGFAISNIDLNASGNVGLASFVFPKNGQLVTGFNSQVSASEFLGALKDKNVLGESSNINIVTVGFWSTSGKSYHTIEFNVRDVIEANMPKSLFDMMKNGGIGQSYDMSGLKADASCFAELAYGYSRKITDNISVGGRAKLLIGLGAMDINANKMKVTITDAGTALDADASMRIATQAVTMGMKDGSYDLGTMKFNAGKLAGLNGFGAALDLGFSFDNNDGLVASLAVNDIGGISWKYNMTGNSVSGTSTGSASSIDDFGNIANFKPAGEGKGFKMLPFSVNAGVRYVMPFYDKLSAGVFTTYRNDLSSYFNARLGATITPAKWFSATVNLGAGTYGATYGAAFSITGGVFNFFAGIESFFGKVAAGAPIPLNKFRTTANVGITFRFGERHNY